MNRRDILKYGAAALGLVGLGGISKSKEPAVETSSLPIIDDRANLRYYHQDRKRYYETCEKFALEHPGFLSYEVINPVVRRITEHLKTIRYFNETAGWYLPKVYEITGQVALYGDWFGEIVPRQPELYFYPRVNRLPPHTMYRIETIKGDLVEFQQTTMGCPDYKSLSECKVDSPEAKNSPYAVRFKPSEIVHIRNLSGHFNGIRRAHGCYPYPYGTSALETGINPVFEHDVYAGLAELGARIEGWPPYDTKRLS